MSLKEKIEEFKQQLTTKVPEETFKVMSDETERLKQSGITDKSLKVGDKATTFSLPNIEGKLVSSEDLLAKGPLVVSFYRGGW